MDTTKITELDARMNMLLGNPNLDIGKVRTARQKITDLKKRVLDFQNESQKRIEAMNSTIESTVKSISDEIAKIGMGG